MDGPASLPTVAADNRPACPLVIITWEDSRQPVAEWRFVSDLPEGNAVKCATVGWLLRDGDDAKVIAQSVGDIESEDKAQTCGVMVIPTRCVIRIDRLVEEGEPAVLSTDPGKSTTDRADSATNPAVLSLDRAAFLGEAGHG